MTKLQTILLAILCFALAGLAYKFIPNFEAVAAALLALGTYLGGTARLHPEDRAKIEASTPEQPKGPDIKGVASVLIIIAALGTTSCKTTPTTPDSFFGAVVTCTKDNSHNDQVGAAVLNCLMNAAGGNYSACLAGLPALGNWTLDEVACVVRQYATESSQRINSGNPAPSDSVILERANEWIRSQQVKYR